VSRNSDIRFILAIFLQIVIWWDSKF
jgi:hypothetical protein